MLGQRVLDRILLMIWEYVAQGIQQFNTESPLQMLFKNHTHIFP